MANGRDPRLFFFLLMLFLFITNQDPQPQPFAPGSHFDDVVADEWAAVAVLNSTRFGDLDVERGKWLNLTGLREDDKFAWDLLPAVKERAKEQLRYVLGAEVNAVLDSPLHESSSFPVYRNLSGYVQGEWTASSLGRIRHPSDFNASELFPENPVPFVDFDRNITGRGGDILVRISEQQGRMETDANRTISEIEARITIGDDTAIGNWWEFQMNGVHFPRLGATVLTTTSEKFAGVFALPHFMVSESLYIPAQHFLNRTIPETIQRQENRPFPVWNPWTSAADGSSDSQSIVPRCEFIMYLQEHPVQFLAQPEKSPDQSIIEWIEEELRYPTGARLPRRSPMTMSMVAISPDCGFVIESKGPPNYSPLEGTHLVGSKTEEFGFKAKNSIIVFASTLTAQILLLVKQMKETATPSTRNRVSFWSISMFALGDGFSCLALVFLHLVFESSQVILYATGFIAMFSVIFEMRFLMDIWTVQATERIRQRREQRSSTGTPTPDDAANTTVATPGHPTSTPENTNSLPLPVTTGRGRSGSPVPSIIVTPDQGTDTAGETNNAPGEAGTEPSPRAELSTLYTRYCLFLLFLFFLTLHSASMWSAIRSFYFNTLFFFYLSFWCPQIYRNIMRNCRKALRWDFVFGQSAARLIPIAYFYLVPDNLLLSHNNARAFLVLVGWVWVQILALLSQELLGSRFFIREGWAPPAYDYHPILREDEEGANMPIGPQTSDEDASFRKAGEAKGKGKKVFDCTICAQDIEVPVVPSGEAGEGSTGIGGLVLTRRAYMVTPCRHIFHTPCLEGWMRYRLQCPNCREILPPL